MKVYVTQVHASHKPSDEDPLVTRLDVYVAHAMWSNGAVTYGEGPSMLSAGATPAEIIQTLLAKMMKNRGRRWPDWRTLRDGEPTAHIR